MAEAHSAVAFSFNVTHEGVDVQFNHDALRAVFFSGVQSWKMRMVRFKNNVINFLYPAPPISFLAVVAFFMAVQLWLNVDLSFGSIEVISSTMPYCAQAQCKHLAYLLLACAMWVLFILVWRYTLKAMLTYQSWMYEPRGRMGLKTKIWLGLMTLFKGRRPLLYSYQASLPKLPVPSLENTKRRYLQSVRPLLNDAEFKNMSGLADEFFDGIAKKCQRYLVFKSWWASNYVTDWWEEYVYLSGRGPIMVNSNYYGLDARYVHPTTNQAARAGSVTHCFLQYREELEMETLKPLLVNNTAPLCSAQYERMFNTTRIPGVKADKIVHVPTSNHIVVYHKGRYFKVFTHVEGVLVGPKDLEGVMLKILSDETKPCTGELELAALTAGSRLPWAQAREAYFSQGVNRRSLATIEQAAFVVVLDEENHEYDDVDKSKVNRYARSMLHGKCYDRWFDKSFNLIISANGLIGFNAEHSWADAPIMSQMWEYSFYHDIAHDEGYNKDGTCAGVASDFALEPVKLAWDISPACMQVIQQSLSEAQKLADDVDIHIEFHTNYGKGLMKKARISPDAYIQMALQLAYRRDIGNYPLTYEASMTRLFREGRTETVRSCTTASANFVEAMLAQKPNEECKNLLKIATDAHQKGYRDAMTGRGIDRHLFCLYVVSKYLEVDSPFLKKVLSEPWRLSTSQTPHSQLGLINLDKNPNHLCVGGGFGPVSDDGYGVSYIVAGDDHIFFHISSKFSAPNTNSKRFGESITQAFEDIKNMLEV